MATGVPFKAALPGELASKKNSQVARFVKGRFVGMMENRKVVAVQERLVSQLREAMSSSRRPHGPGNPMFPSESCELRVIIDKECNVTSILVIPLCPKPKKRNHRKRDIQNELATVCDALQKAGVVGNDNQFATIIVQRLVEGGTIA